MNGTFTSNAAVRMMPAGQAAQQQQRRSSSGSAGAAAHDPPHQAGNFRERNSLGQPSQLRGSSRRINPLILSN
jgi:hypothetical protein